MTRLFIDLTPLTISQPYRRMWVGLGLAGVATQVTNVTVGLQTFEITHSSTAVGLVGLFALVPLVVLGLYGGSIVDAHDRRTVTLISSLGLWAVSLCMLAQALLELEKVWILYGLVALQNGCFALYSPARTAIVPRLIPHDLLPAANALSNLSMNTGLMVGPVVAGFMVSRFGYQWSYTLEAVTLAIAVLTIYGLPAIVPQGDVRPAGLRSVFEGLTFLAARPNLRMTFLVDMASMVLANPRSLLPVVGALWVGGRSQTVGWLASAIAVGSVSVALLSGPLMRVVYQGRAVLYGVGAWGLAMIGFGVSVLISPDGGRAIGLGWTLLPACLFLALAGAADAVSGMFRNTITQVVTPDALRGRVQAALVVVVVGGPYLGEFIAGTLGDLINPGPAAILGGTACIAGTIVLNLFHPTFRAYDRREPKP